MSSTAGWILWFNDGRRVREVTIAEPNRDEARQRVFEKVPDAEMVSYQEVRDEVIGFFEMKRGSMMESVTMDGSPIRPRGTRF